MHRFAAFCGKNTCKRTPSAKKCAIITGVLENKVFHFTKQVFPGGHSMENEVTIRIGGESGEGTISGGDILALASARWGYHVYTFRTFPAEILGGPCLFQVRIGEHPIKSMGDYDKYVSIVTR